MMYYLLSNNTNLLDIYTLCEANISPVVTMSGRLLCNNNKSSLETPRKAFYIDLQTFGDEKQALCTNRQATVIKASLKSMTIFNFPIYAYSRDVSYASHNAIRVGFIFTAYLVLNFTFMFIYQEYKNTCKYFKRHTKLYKVNVKIQERKKYEIIWIVMKFIPTSNAL